MVTPKSRDKVEDVLRSHHNHENYQIMALRSPRAATSPNKASF